MLFQKDFYNFVKLILTNTLQSFEFHSNTLLFNEVSNKFYLKKILIIFALLFTIPTFAQDIVRIDAYELAVRVGDEWSDWEKCNVPIKLDFDKGKITIYSDEVQIYTLLQELSTNKDSYGRSVSYKVIDQDKYIGTFRFRVQNNGVRQIYLSFGEIGWVYNVSVR